MANRSATLQSQQRLRVFDAYRGRGRRTNALWLVHSVKMDRDLIISSDRRFVHWLVFLEADPNVKSFEPMPPADRPVPDGSIEVNLVDGSQEKHLVFADNSTLDELRSLGREKGWPEAVKIFNDVHLKPVVPLAMRWQSALAFASAIRDKELTSLRLALISLLRSAGAGTLGHVLKGMNGFDESTTVGVFVRLAVEGHLTIDLASSRFSYATPWIWCER